MPNFAAQTKKISRPVLHLHLGNDQSEFRRDTAFPYRGFRGFPQNPGKLRDLTLVWDKSASFNIFPIYLLPENRNVDSM